MPFNEKVNLEQYFEDEIERVSSSEICAVKRNTDRGYSQQRDGKDIEAEAQREAGWWKSRSCGNSTANLPCA
ncbi:MAG: hypothetical protein V8T10_08915 [Merdibacter sp.]